MDERRSHPKAAALLVCALLCSGGSALAQSPYRLTILDAGRDTTPSVVDINDLGQVAGFESASRATLWNGSSATFLDGLGSQAMDINDSGQIVGFNAAGQATLWQGPSALELGTPDGYSGSASAINNAGQIVGTLTQTPSVLDQRAALWNGAAAIDLNSLLRPESVEAGWLLTSASGINDSGWIVGTAYNLLEGCVPIMCDAHGFVLSISDLPDQVLDITTAVPEPSTYALMLAGLGAIDLWARRRRAASFWSVR